MIWAVIGTALLAFSAGVMVGVWYVLDTREVGQ